MLQQDNRLRKLRDFNLVMKHGQWVNGRFLDIKVLELASARGGSANLSGKNTFTIPKKEDLESFKKQLKLAIAAGLKVHKSAVKRNRVRRQIREVLRLLLKDEKIKNGYYVLVVAKKDVLDKDYAEISSELNLLLSRGKVLKS